MKCPYCQNNLKQLDYKGVKIDECGNCNGKWFDKDELRKAKDSTDDDLRWLDFDLFDEKEHKYNASPSKGKCPQCFSSMISLTYMDSKVVIDKCNKCQGVCLDNKEFEKIIKYLENIVVSEPASEYVKDVAKEFEEIFKGPENRISEIKDFLAIMKLYQLRLSVENPWTIKLSQSIDRYWPIR